jgi:hypothetical protein
MASEISHGIILALELYVMDGYKGSTFPGVVLLLPHVE